MRARMCSLMLLDEAREWLDLRASFGAGDAYINKPRLSAERKPDRRGGAPEKTAAGRQRADRHALSKRRAGAARRPGFAVERAADFFRAKHRCLERLHGAALHFSNEEIKILSALAELSAIAIEKARLYERVVDVEEQLRQNEKLSALGLLAAEVAHEIRNPLTVMKLLYHSLDLKFDAKDPRSQGRADHRGQNRAPEQDRGADSGFCANDGAEVCPGESERPGGRLGLLVRHKLANQGIKLVRDLQPDLPLVPGDATQLEQAFLNLILNAAEAMADRRHADHRF
jgi:signal transduction histidine kinase